MKSKHENNKINVDAERLCELDNNSIADCPRAPDWLPIPVYNLVQMGDPEPDHGEMVRIRPDSSNAKGELLPPDGMWCKVADVRALLQEEETRRQHERDILNTLVWEAERL